MLEEYKKQLKYFLTNKKYIIPVIFVAILSYGFAITHYSIGVDDLCFDKYVTGPYILSAGRWGTWTLYNLFRIIEFTPFWLDFIVATFMIIIAVVLCAFLKKEIGDKINTFGYIIFSSLLISNPLINQFYIYQSTDLSIVISNLWIIISAIYIYEKFFSERKTKKIVYITTVLLMSIPLSMYESCAQSYLVIMFLGIFIKLLQGEKDYKKLLKYFCFNIAILIFSIIVYFIIGKIFILVLNILGLTKPDLSLKKIMWTYNKFLEETILDKITILKHFTIDQFKQDFLSYLPVTMFFIFGFLAILVEIINAYKSKNAFKLFILLGMILSNFILIVLTIMVLYRIQFSWILTTAFLGLYFYCLSRKHKKLHYVVITILIFIIVLQTKNLNQLFFNDYKRYEFEKVAANQIAVDLIKGTNYKEKPIIYVNELEMSENLNKNYDNGYSVFLWGLNAFEKKGEEITKFINYFGYEFLIATQEQYEDATEQYNELTDEEKKNNIVELENYIIVNLEKY